MKRSNLIRLFGAAAWLLLFVPPALPSAAQQRPSGAHRDAGLMRQSGDTLFIADDTLVTGVSVPHGRLFYRFFPEKGVVEELHVAYPDGGRPLPVVRVRYRLPQWSVYRRSVTKWGVTFSAGKAPLRAPYPAAAALDAEVLTFPL